MLVSSIGYFNVAGVVSSDNNAQKNQSASRITSSEKFGQVHASEIISSKNMVFKPEYVMSMITKITTNSLIQTVREYNASINNAKMEE